MVAAGNVIFSGDSYRGVNQGEISPNGRIYVELVARGELTDVLQSSIPLRIFSTRPNSLQGQFPPQNLQVPVGGQITRVDFRLPRQPSQGDEPIFGVDLPRNCTLVGTTGENLKVSPTTGSTHTTTAPVIAAANNSYTPNSQAVLSRPDGVADAAGLLTTVSGSPLVLQATVSNAGNTAAGSGIRLSQTGARAFIFARVIFSLPGDAIAPWGLDLPAMPG